MSEGDIASGLRRMAVAAGLALGAVAAASAATITVDHVRQHYPWNNLVDVDYTIDGITDDPYNYRVEMSVETVEDGVRRTILCSNFADCAWCDLTTSNGSWRTTWDANADGMTHFDAAAEVKLKLVHEPIDEAEADYLIVDLASGSGSSCYPVRYVRTPNVESNQFNKTIYKTRRLVMKRIEANTFVMGNKGESVGPYSAPYPATNHTVQLTKDYFIGVYMFTQKQYRLVTGSCPGRTGSATEENPPAERPVDSVSWNTLNASDSALVRLNARAAAGLVAVTGFGLPTEAQWECACRAGCPATYAYFWWSDSYSTAKLYAWIETNYPQYPVGRKLPNDWGLYDMCGNLLEWCSDWYDLFSRDPAFVEGGVTIDPTGPESGTMKVARGGWLKQQSWGAYLRAGGREAGDPAGTSVENSGAADVGFRVIKTTTVNRAAALGE